MNIQVKNKTKTDYTTRTSNNKKHLFKKKKGRKGKGNKKLIVINITK